MKDLILTGFIKGNVVKHTYRVDAKAHVHMKNGSYAGCSVVYKKTLPVSLVHGLIDHFRKLKDITTPPNYTGFTESYQVHKGILDNAFRGESYVN